MVVDDGQVSATDAAINSRNETWNWLGSCAERNLAEAISITTLTGDQGTASEGCS